jgi:hypothetical protein
MKPYALQTFRNARLWCAGKSRDAFARRFLTTFTRRADAMNHRAVLNNQRKEQRNEETKLAQEIPERNTRRTQTNSG